MSMSLDKLLLEEIALVKSGISEAFIEKDWFVTQVIMLLAESQHPDFSLVFTGGTSLSKAHKLIERFSEDIDFRVIAPSFQLHAKSKVRKALSDFKKQIIELLEKQFNILEVIAKDGNKHITINMAYPTICTPSEALRPHIKLELTLSSLLLPSVLLPVSSFINEVLRKEPEISEMACINPVENAADKLSALVWRIPSRIRGEGDKQPDIVRHLHDLAKLSDQAITHKSFTELAIQTIERDAKRAQRLTSLSSLDKLNKMIEILENDKIYPKEYVSFVSEMAYNQETPIPTFEEAFEKLRLLTEMIKGELTTPL